MTPTMRQPLRPRFSITAGSLMLASLVQISCAKPARLNASREATDAGEAAISGDERAAARSLSRKHEGEFSRVEQIEGTVSGATGDEIPVSVVMGERRETATWVVIRAAREEAGVWVPISDPEARSFAAALLEV